MEDGEYFLASDVPAFLEYTDSVVYLEDGDVVIVDDDDGVEFTDLAGNPSSASPKRSSGIPNRPARVSSTTSC